MKKTLLIILVFISLGINKIYAQETPDYKVKVSYDEYGWHFCSLVNNSNITILCYANKNEYHKSGKPIYILQGTIGAPDNRNIILGEGDSNAGAVTFKVIFSDSKKKRFYTPAWNHLVQG
jgi:hypothetical protein